MLPIFIIKILVVLLVTGFYLGLVAWFLLKVLGPWLKQHGGWCQLSDRQKVMTLSAYFIEFSPIIYLIYFIKIVLS